jgi:penicillin-binding protein 1A
MDAPLEIDTGSGVWKPENYEGKFYGPSTLRFGIERSRNVMTVRLAQDIGMPMIGEYAKRMGIYDNLPPYLSFALGAGETTPAHGRRPAMPDNPAARSRRRSSIAPGPLRPPSTGTTSANARGATRPNGRTKRPTLIDKASACSIDDSLLITSMMEGVVARGTAAGVGFAKEVGKPIAGKTGNTNDEKDVWFIGFSPDMVVGVFMATTSPSHRRPCHWR